MTFATAQKMFLKDGYHVTVLFLLKDGKPVRISELRGETPSDKYLVIRQIGHEVVKVGADAAVLLGEVWSAKADPAKPYRRAADAPDREEFLVGTLVRRDGDPLQLAAQIERAGKKVTLAEVHEMHGGAHFQFAPLYSAWGKPIPEEWKKLSPVSMKKDADVD